MAFSHGKHEHHPGHGHTHGTHEKIEKHAKKHRKEGGKVESPMRGKDEADEDLRDKPADRTFPGGGGKREEKVGEAAEAMEAKRGGKIKKRRRDGGKVAGTAAFHNGGRAKRNSGGGCEERPFTAANKATPPKGRELMRMSEGKDRE
jgi:hypothetical protein